MTDGLGGRIALLAGAEIPRALHSGLIATSWIACVKRRLGSGFRYYRLGYNVFALATFLPLVAFERRLHSEALFAWDDGWAWVRYGVLAAVAIIAVATARQYDMLAFIGLRQLRHAEPTESGAALGSLNTSGMLALSRHPWYFAALLFLWVRRDLDPVTIVSNGVLSAYLVVGTLLEERKLVAEFGDRYRSYQQRVSMLIPLKWLSESRNRPPKGP